jgi:ribose transport system ATP-binding protein
MAKSELPSDQPLPSPPPPSFPVVAVSGLTMQFPGVRALDNVDFDLTRSEVHGLVGENGAGKSTLMKLLSGLYRPTAGRILIDGKPVLFRHPIDAQRRGIVMIHQELNLVDELSIADNIFLGREIRQFGLVAGRTLRRRAAEWLGRLHCSLDPAMRVRRLSIAQKQMVEIAKALSADARVLIMDEPTAVLSRREVQSLFELVHRLKQQGVSIVYISHILPEIFRICDRATVLRDGKVVITLGPEMLRKTTERNLASMMVGRPLTDHFPKRSAGNGKAILHVSRLSVRGLAGSAMFDVRAGEILGFAGLIGAGRTELAEGLVGLRKATESELFLDGMPIEIHDLHDAIRHGIAYLPEDRKATGLTMGMSVAANTTIVSLKRYARPLISRRRENAAAAGHVRDLRIKVASVKDPIDSLSGGNQQKVALAKWLEVRPRILIVDEPTRGVDIGAKEQIYALLKRLTDSGMALILISSELNELLGLCHRIAVMRAGKIVGIVDGATATEESLMHLAAGVATAQTDAGV